MAFPAPAERQRGTRSLGVRAVRAEHIADRPLPQGHGGRAFGFPQDLRGCSPVCPDLGVEIGAKPGAGQGGTVPNEQVPETFSSLIKVFSVSPGSSLYMDPFIFSSNSVLIFNSNCQVKCKDFLKKTSSGDLQPRDLRGRLFKREAMASTSD